MPQVSNTRHASANWADANIHIKGENKMNNENQIIMLGTGNAIATRCYNTCFVLKAGGDKLLVDAGGGNGILTQLERARIPLADLHHLFLTHAHTDHLLGAVWVVRMAIHRMKNGAYQGDFHVHSHDKALHVLHTICSMTLAAKDLAYIGKRVHFHEHADGETFHAGGFRLQCFDIHSAKEKQFGFRTALPDGQTLACLGDEPFNPLCRPYAEGCDWLLCEAFCLYADRERFKPYEKHHSTAIEAGATAQELHARHLVLYHTEDRTLHTRKTSYAQEAQLHFHGQVHVPDDLETIALDEE